MNSLKVVPARKVWHILLLVVLAQWERIWFQQRSMFLTLFGLFSNCGQVAVTSGEIPDRFLNLRL